MVVNCLAVRKPVVSQLKACAKKKDLCKGAILHADIVKMGWLETDLHIASAVVNMYAKSGDLAKAQLVLDGLPVRDVVTWSAVITGYAYQGNAKEALECFDWMQHEGLSADAITFASILKACGSTRAAEKGKQVHEQIMSQGLLGEDVVLGTALVDMYVKCALLVTAHKVLEELPTRDVVSWNALLSGYAQHERGEEAIECFEQMQNEGLSPDAITFVCVLKACGSLEVADKGEQIHDQIANKDLLLKDVGLGTGLVDMYVKCGLLAKARKVLEGLPVRDVVTWSALIAGYAQQGQGEKALGCLQQMLREGLFPNEVTYVSILRACGCIGAADEGKQIHDEIVRKGLLAKSTILGTALVDMYAKCGALTKAQLVLDGLHLRDSICWSALITGYARQGQGKEALYCLEQMRLDGLAPDTFTFACVLKACGIAKAAEKGKRIHDEIVSEGLLGDDAVLRTALVDMYSRCGVLTKAQQILDELPVRDVFSWNAIIAGYALLEHGEEALNCFEQMEREGLSPDTITFISTLKACGTLGAAERGEHFHREIMRKGLLDKDLVLGTALLDMYAKCGMLGKAEKVLEELPVRNIVAWNALLAGYGQQVNGEEALSCFEQMQQEGLPPDAVTFTCLLNACSRSGLVDEGQLYLGHMSKKYGIVPAIEHHTCMVDLFGRAGHFDKAIAVIKKMSNCFDRTIWSALLNACLKWENWELAKWAFKCALQADETDSSAYTCMANIYAAVGMHMDAPMIELVE